MAYYELENWDPGEVFVDGRYISSDTWYDGEGKPFQPQAHYPNRVSERIA
jgi:hypothetical protein